MAADFDPFSIAALPDPYPAYAELRAQAPIYRSSQGPWVVSRYADVQPLLSDQRFAHWTAPPVEGGESPGLLARVLGALDASGGPAQPRLFASRRRWRAQPPTRQNHGR